MADALRVVYDHWFVTCLMIGTFGLWIRFPILAAWAERTEKKS